ncbi:MAG TPA: hypothetical protein VLD18_13360, partial [Verrucomicrobiae bacterium]|nr:hypothetical protein [Verrucomicrobiae bacterium]
MKPIYLTAILCTAFLGIARAQWPENLVVEGVPEIPADLKEQAGRYLEFRSAGFSGWHPRAWEMFVLTRFADVTQLHRVAMAGGARRQLTFGKEPIREAVVQPKDGNYVVFLRDTGGGEFYQLFRLDLDTGQTTLLTDGRSRNLGPRFARGGQLMAYTSTRRNGRDNDLYLMNPAQPDSNRLLLEVKGGGWSVSDWSPDEKQLLVT